MKWYTSLSINFFFPLSVIFLPKSILFFMVRVYADLRYKGLMKYKKSNGEKQRYNAFINRQDDSINAFEVFGNKNTESNRQIDRSLRNIVLENRKQMAPAITSEEKSMQILSDAQ